MEELGTSIVNALLREATAADTKEDTAHRMVATEGKTPSAALKVAAKEEVVYQTTARDTEALIPESMIVAKEEGADGTAVNENIIPAAASLSATGEEATWVEQQKEAQRISTEEDPLQSPELFAWAEVDRSPASGRPGTTSGATGRHDLLEEFPARKTCAYFQVFAQITHERKSQVTFKKE
eukprot:GHVU01014999.1.p1 GENE.GHVU01014999.1~~GHVU01014999.1.p1  ORF type:complete len:181 (-),score=37.67 GHVU01014999.1:534-1076(-)